MKRRVLCLMLALLFCIPFSAARAAVPIELDCRYDPTDNQVVVQDVPDETYLYVAGYQSDGKMLFIEATSGQSGTATIPLPEVAFDKLKLFALDGNHAPICAAAIPVIPALKGFVPYLEKLDISLSKTTQETISGAEMTALLDKLVAYAAPEKLAEWQTMYPVLRTSDKALLRIDVLSSVFLAGQFIGGEYASLPGEIDHENAEFRSLVELEECATWELFGDVPNFKVGEDFEDHFGIVSHIYNTSRTCLIDGSRIMSYDADAGSFHLQDEAAFADALLAVLRCVSIAETEYTVSVDSEAATSPSGILTEKLIEKSNSNPVVTSVDHPRWTGFVLGYGYIGEMDVSARDIKLTADWGFNSVRAMLHYKTLFSADAQTVDFAMLLELDKLVAAAIENDVHLNICFNALPGRSAELDADYNAGGDFDLFINPEKQEMTLRIFEMIAARYKDVSNFNLSITPIWEPLNRNLSTGLPAPEYTPEDIAVFLGEAIDAIRAVDPDRLVIYEAASHVFESEVAPSKAVADEKGNVMINYNDGEDAYIYACMTATEGKHIDDMNNSMYLVPYPNYIYNVASHIESGEKLTLNGLLPAGTKMKLYLSGSGGSTLDISADGRSVHSEFLPNAMYEVGEYLSSWYSFAESDKCIEITLENDADELVIAVSGGFVGICGIKLTLPEEYAVERWYYVQAYDVHLGNEEEAGVVKRKTSEVLICPNSYEGEGRSLVIHEDLSYSTESLFAEGSERTINERTAKMNEFDGNCIVRFERGTFGGAVWSDLKEYYEDTLQSYEEYGFSWWSNDWWEITNNTRTIAEAEYIEYAGYEHFNMELLQLLQKYQS